jgi:hypothetical protein
MHIWKMQKQKGDAVRIHIRGKKDVDGQVIETWTFRKPIQITDESGHLMQSGRSTTEPHAPFVFHELR